MRVERLERIVGPLDDVDAHPERARALCQLQPQAQAGVAGVARNPEHVRPLNEPAVLQRQDRVDKPFHRPTLAEGPGKNPAPLQCPDPHAPSTPPPALPLPPPVLSPPATL